MPNYGFIHVVTVQAIVTTGLLVFELELPWSGLFRCKGHGHMSVRSLLALCVWSKERDMDLASPDGVAHQVENRQL